MIRFIGRIPLISIILCFLCFLILNFYLYSINIGCSIRISRTDVNTNVSYKVYTNKVTKKNLNISVILNTTKNVAILAKINKSPVAVKNVWAMQMQSRHLIGRLQRIRKNFQLLNKYHVNFKGRINQKLSPNELLCQLKFRVNMTTLLSSDLPASAKSWSQYLPRNRFEEVAGRMGRCAVVTSAGSMKFSRLGQEIDSHDAVLRFNSAPTDGFQTDVGSKTTFRIVNSQIVTLPEHKFLDNPIYNQGILLMWDPVPYLSDIHQSYKPEFKYFERYIMYRKQNPKQPFFILNPKSSWQLWNIIQENAPELIQPNPPSSGSLGILLMMNLCDEVNVYEFLPSSRMTDRCYYYGAYFDKACTFGAYHPLIYEKNVIRELNRGDDSSIFKYGKVTLPGLRDLQC